MRYKIILYVLIIVVMLISVYCVYFLPRNLTLKDFEGLKYNELSIVVLAKLGKPSNVDQGGIALWHFAYFLLDGNDVYLTFGMNLLQLKTCQVIRENQSVKVIVP